MWNVQAVCPHFKQAYRCSEWRERILGLQIGRRLSAPVCLGIGTPYGATSFFLHLVLPVCWLGLRACSLRGQARARAVNAMIYRYPWNPPVKKKTSLGTHPIRRKERSSLLLATLPALWRLPSAGGRPSLLLATLPAEIHKFSLFLTNFNSVSYKKKEIF